MKTNPRRFRAAFTLIELMAVITIIVILAGLVVGGMGFVNERQAKEKAKVQIALLTKALEEYKLDIGDYPLTADTSTGTGKSAELYVALFYEGYDYAKKGSPSPWTKKVGGVDVPKATKIYLPELDPVNSKQGWTTTSGTTPPASTTIVDPWGKEYAYRTAVRPGGASNSNTQNPDFDLWSYGKDGKTRTAQLTHQDNKDDITNF
jgi:prepilin-type N-terminal cleavage/methylation domain-containing protein